MLLFNENKHKNTNLTFYLSKSMLGNERLTRLFCKSFKNEKKMFMSQYVCFFANSTSLNVSRFNAIHDYFAMFSFHNFDFLTGSNLHAANKIVLAIKNVFYRFLLLLFSSFKNSFVNFVLVCT